MTRNAGLSTRIPSAWARVVQLHGKRITALAFCFYAMPDGKPLHTFPGIALLVLRNSGRKTASHFSWNCSTGSSQFRTENRFTLFLELL
ncbi:hypothetical protein GFL86_06595 [Rhizobium laguerreae]|nr:hypothetical protein [Rhizobium laguerreae]